MESNLFSLKADLELVIAIDNEETLEQLNKYNLVPDYVKVGDEYNLNINVDLFTPGDVITFARRRRDLASFLFDISKDREAELVLKAAERQLFNALTILENVYSDFVGKKNE